jgi:hypothetical protein
VARGTFRRVHVTFGDIIGSHHSCLSFQLAGTWCTSMCPHPFQSKIQQLDFSWIYYAYPFGILGFLASGVRASSPLELLFAETPKLRSILPLDPMVTYDLWCRSFRDFAFCYFATCENKGSCPWVFWVPKRRPTTMFSPMDGHDEFWDFAYRDFCVPAQLQRVFLTLRTFSRSDGHEGSPSLPNRSQGSNTSSVVSSLPVAIYHTDCGFITPLHLLSFVSIVK